MKYRSRKRGRFETTRWRVTNEMQEYTKIVGDLQVQGREEENMDEVEKEKVYRNYC